MDFNLAIMLQESAKRVPDKPVAILDDVRLTYAELDQLSNRVAANLTAVGIGPGDTVGLQLPNLPQFIVAYFGILKAGAIVVPMNVLLKAPEIAFYLSNSQAKMFITFAGVAAEASKGAADAGVSAIYSVNIPGLVEAPELTPFDTLLGGEDPGPQLLSRSPQDTAVIIYTSGTTGRPKGAELSHFTLYMNADVPGRLFDLQEDDVSLYMARSYDFIIDLLNRFDRADPFALDPAGITALRAAKKVRRATLRRGGDDEEIADQARSHFGMPRSTLGFANRLSEPLYPPPARDANN